MSNFTLKGEELFKYLEKLEKELDRQIVSDNVSGSENFTNLMHRQMVEIIMVEKQFLEKLSLPILSLSKNGLPEAESLNMDLEKMSEEKGDGGIFGIIKKYKTGTQGKNHEKPEIYSEIPKINFEKEIEKLEEPTKEIGISINEKEGKLELKVREDIYIKGYDEYSKGYPYLIREGSVRYNVIWNNLISESQEKYYLANVQKTEQKDLIQNKKIFDDVNRSYEFLKNDYNFKMPWFESKPSNYVLYLKSGTAARIKIARNILIILDNIFGKEILLGKINPDNGKASSWTNRLSEDLFSFDDVPYVNAPTTIPQEPDDNEGDNIKKTFKDRFCKKFELSYPTYRSSDDPFKVGEVEYVLPHINLEYIDPYCRSSSNEYRHIFVRGEVNLRILGSVISNEEQYSKLLKLLKNVKTK